MPRIAVLFPGQGSLTPESGDRARAQWPELVDRACELLGADPFEHASTSTAYAQPAIFVSGLAAFHAEPPPAEHVCAMAGHSLGELTALTAAGALSAEDGLALVILRGRLMAEAAERRPGRMLALLGATAEQAAEFARRHGVSVANDNAPGQIVLSGSPRRLEAARGDARESGLKAMELDVTGAFHSPDMRPAVLPLLRAVERTRRRPTGVPVVSGYSARPFSDLPLELSRALVSPVRWREVMQQLLRLGATDFVDMGPGTVLARLVKRNVRSADAVAA